MKKFYTLSFILLASLSFGQAFTGTYDFAGIATVAPATAPTNGLTDPSPVPTAAGVTFGSFSAVISSSVTTIPAGSTGAGRFSYGNQPLGATTAVDTYNTLTGALDPAIYYQVTITPQSGFSMDLTQLTFKSQKSGTGARTYAVRSSVDGYAANLPASISPANAELSVQAGNVFFRNLDAITTGQAGNTITFGAGFTAITTPVVLRFYGWNAEAAGGSFSIDDVIITGTTATLSVKQNTISGLSMYPNPVSNGNLYITSNSSQAKSVAIFDILGKQVVKTTTSNNAVNVANLKSGVYIVKISEEGKTDTRKLIIE